MNRPYTICHIFSALDGAITGNFMSLAETEQARKQYTAFYASLNGDAVLYGTRTMLDFCDGYAGKPAKAKPVERKDYIATHEEDKYVIAIDRYGELAYSQNYLIRHGERKHIIEVLTQAVSNDYLAYLRTLGISYIFAGDKDLDCELALIKLKELFNIQRLIIAGGGYINWAFADAGVIDELSLVLAPAADGEQKVTVFERTESSVHPAISFTLKDMQRTEGNGVWLRYAFNPVKKE